MQTKEPTKPEQFSIRMNVEPALHTAYKQYCLTNNVILREGCDLILQNYLRLCSSSEFRREQYIDVPNAPTRGTSGTEEKCYWISMSRKQEITDTVEDFRTQLDLGEKAFGNNSLLYKAFVHILKFQPEEQSEPIL